MVLDKSLFDSSKEEVVESCVDEKDENFGGSVPVFVYLHEAGSSVKGRKRKEAWLTVGLGEERDVLGSI